MKDFDEIKSIKQDIESVSRFHKEYALKHRVKVQRGMILFQISMDNLDEAEPVKIVRTLSVNFETKERVSIHRTEFNPILGTSGRGFESHLPYKDFNFLLISEKNGSPGKTSHSYLKLL